MSKVSIIVPIYNVSEYVDQCIDSAIKQTYTNIEIILVNDGSTDNSGEKCELWRKQDERIKVIHKENGGLSSARNAGLDTATGKYIYFLDGDDYIAPELLSVVIPYMEKGIDIVSFQYSFVYPNGEMKISAAQSSDVYMYNEKERIDFYIESLSKYGNGWEAWSRVYRRNHIEQYGLRFEDNRRIFAEDLYFYLCYCTKIHSVKCLPDHLYYYRQRNDSIMGRVSSELNAGRMNELGKALLKYLEEKECKELIEIFPIIHYLLSDHVIEKYRCENKLSVMELRNRLLNDIQDYVFYKDCLKKVCKHKDLLSKKYPGALLEEKLSEIQFLNDGNYVALVIRNKFIYKFWNRLEAKSKYKKDAELEEAFRKFSNNEKGIYLIGTEDFGNTGDHQIAESILTYISEFFSEYSVMEITASEYEKNKPYLDKYMNKENLIFLTGGGNFGDLYPFAQYIREDVIETWKENPKFIFPQTIHFCKENKELLQKAQKIFCKENKVSIFAREAYSYELAKKMFSCECYLVPDIVLFKGKHIVSNQRKNILFCMRDDIEKKLDQEDECDLLKYVQMLKYKTEKIDLQVSCNVSKRDRRSLISKKMNQFLNAKLVITDRLHGMIFAAITGTPCVAFDNFNHKIKYTYDWLSYLPYIRYVNTVEEAKNEIMDLMKMKDCRYDNTPLLPYYETMTRIIKYAIN